MSRVFIVNEPLRRTDEGTYVRHMDTSSASEFGEVVYLLPPGFPPNDPEGSLPALREKLADFSADDYLVMIGHPMLISWTAALAARAAGGKLKILQWNRNLQRYMAVPATIWTA